MLDLRPERRVFRVDAAEDARLRFNTSYFPGWTLYVDGTERAIVQRPPYGAMEFAVGAGVHEVRFVFEDTPTRRLALWISLLSLVAMAAMRMRPYPSG